MNITRFFILIIVALWVTVEASGQISRPGRPAGPGGFGMPRGSLTNANRTDSTGGTSHLPGGDAAAEGTEGIDTTAVPRVLETYVFNDTLIRQRIFAWQHNRYLNTPVIVPVDTSAGAYRMDMPFLRDDTGADYLGTPGAPAVGHHYFTRETNDHFYYFNPYLSYAITPHNILFYNTKTAYTRFHYSGTLFGNSSFEESNAGMLITANVVPEWNWSVQYRHFGTKGLLQREATNNNAFTLATSYSGKRYHAQGGFIYNYWDNEENGGVTDDRLVLDTIIDARTTPVSLLAASSLLSNYSFFVTQTYGVPLNFFRQDTLSGDGTVIYFGHAAEYTAYNRVYTDQIAPDDAAGRAYYDDAFFIHPTVTRDSMQQSLFDNKLFFTFQPWSSTAIVSNLSGGVGYSYISSYRFEPAFYVSPSTNAVQNNLYIYAAASGMMNRYLHWSAFSRYDFAGYTQNDFVLDGTAGISFYPLKQGVHLTGNLLLQTKQPDYFTTGTYANHFVWDNDFDKMITTRLRAKLSIPDWQLEASAGYSLLVNTVYFNDDARPVQHGEEISVLSGYLQKDFRVGLFHFDHRVLLQTSSAPEVLPLPLVSANLTYYLQANLVKNVLTAQIGVDARFNTAYYAHAYNPGAGTFHTQSETKTGNYPYLDAFVHLKWKHAHIFLKVVNVAERWPNSNVFSALHYIRPERTFKLGITWYFY